LSLVLEGVTAARALVAEGAAMPASAPLPLRTGVLSRLTTAVQQPQCEVATGALVLAALGLFLAWKAYTRRARHAAVVLPDAVVTPSPVAVVATAHAQPLTPLADRLRPLSALRTHDHG
jgi:hypothetical protein